MLRLIVSFLVSATIARWIYSEAQLVAPSLIPVLDWVAETTEIPTHDKWPKHSLEKVLGTVGSLTKDAIEAFNERNSIRRTQPPQLEVSRGSQELQALAHRLDQLASS